MVREKEIVNREIKERIVKKMGINNAKSTRRELEGPGDKGSKRENRKEN